MSRHGGLISQAGTFHSLIHREKLSILLEAKLPYPPMVYSYPNLLRCICQGKVLIRQFIPVFSLLASRPVSYISLLTILCKSF